MSSFYDRTERFYIYARENHLDPKLICEIAEKRLEQVQTYLHWCGKQKASVRDLYDNLDNPVRSRILPFWGIIAAAAREYKIENTDFLDPVFELIEIFKAMPPEVFFDQVISNTFMTPIDVLSYTFQDLHSLGHQIAKDSQSQMSDNPYPFGRRTIFNSDHWLTENCPEIATAIGE